MYSWLVGWWWWWWWYSIRSGLMLRAFARVSKETINLLNKSGNYPMERGEPCDKVVQERKLLSP